MIVNAIAVHSGVSRTSRLPVTRGLCFRQVIHLVQFPQRVRVDLTVAAHQVKLLEKLHRLARKKLTANERGFDFEPFDLEAALAYSGDDNHAELSCGHYGFTASCYVCQEWRRKNPPPKP